MFSNPYLDLPMREWPTNLGQTQDSNTAPQFGAKSVNVTSADGPGIGGGPGGDDSNGESGSSSSSGFGQSLGESLGETAAMSGAKGLAVGAITGNIGLGAETAVKGMIGGIPSAIGEAAADSLGFGDTTAANMGQIGGSILGGMALGPVGVALGPVVGGIVGEATGDVTDSRVSEQAIDMAENNFGFFGAHFGASPYGMGQGTIGLGVPDSIGPVTGIEGADDASVADANPAISIYGQTTSIPELSPSDANAIAAAEAEADALAAEADVANAVEGATAPAGIGTGPGPGIGGTTGSSSGVGAAAEGDVGAPF